MKTIADKKITVFIVLAFIVLVAVLIISFYATQKAKVAGDLVEHTQEVLAKSHDVLLDIINIESSSRGYVLTGNETFLENYNKSLVTISGNITALEELSKNNLNQQRRIDSLKDAIQDKLATAKNLIEVRRESGFNEQQITTTLTKGRLQTEKIRSIVASVNAEEFGLLKQRRLANESSTKVSDLLFFLILALIIIIWVCIVIIFRNQKIRNQESEVFNTSQKLLSNYSRSIIEASLDPLFAISRDGKITDMNDASIKITELTREQLIGTNFSKYFAEPDKARQGYEEIFAKGFVTDYPLTILDGKQTPALFNGSVYKDDRGNVLGAVVVARVITEQKRYEKELTEARVFAELATGIAEVAQSKAESATKIAEDATRMAEDAVKAKQQFLSNMSHEIRTPMNAIIGFTKVVLKTELTAKQKEYLTAIKVSGDALIVLINDILDLAKVDAGKMTFEQIPFKLGQSISSMLHLFETKIQEKNLKLVKEYDPQIPEVLLGDPVRLHQIILNLVSNAVKFTTKGKITVGVRLLSQDDKQAIVEFTVADTGIGIPEDRIGRIFENFQQASSGTSRLYGGTGLGLAIVKQLVEPQGGTITVKSKLNEGSTFSFVLSFKKTSAEAEVLIPIVELDEDIKNIKVLVVEDIALNQLLMKTLLDDFGFERSIASNGKIAIEILQEKSYDIILMDLQMPEMNGFEATEYIRKTMNSKIPIIALTADVTTVDLAKCKAVGMNDYIAKPVDERLLYSKIIGLVKKQMPAKYNTMQANERTETQKAKYTDLSYLIKRTKSDPQLMQEMITAYLEQTPPLINTMKQSFQNKDWDMLKSAVHKMIPSFSIMGIHAEHENAAKKIQEYANTQLQEEGINDLVMQLENVCMMACKELEDELNWIKKDKK